MNFFKFKIKPIDVNMLIASIIVAIFVVVLDQFVAPWPMDAHYFFGIIYYPTYLIYYLLSFLIGAMIFSILCNKRGYDLGLILWMRFTCMAIIVSLPPLIAVVFLVSDATIMAIVLTDVFSLILMFYPSGLVFGLLSSRIKRSSTNIEVIQYNRSDIRKSVMNSATVILVEAIVGFVLYL